MNRRLGRGRRAVNIFARMHENRTNQTGPGSPLIQHEVNINLNMDATMIAPRVAFQGELGAFSELAVRMRWPDEVSLVPCRTFDDTVQALLSGNAEFAVIPVENAIAGVVVAARAALDAVGEELQYLGELLVPVHLCVMAPLGATLDGLRDVFSHQMALAQCQRFLLQHAWLTSHVHDDTAGAARDVAAIADLTHGAIAAEAAATRYGLEILARDIQDVSNNWTRFVVVQKNPAKTVTTEPTTTTAGREFRE